LFITMIYITMITIIAITTKVQHNIMVTRNRRSSHITRRLPSILQPIRMHTGILLNDYIYHT